MRHSTYAGCKHFKLRHYTPARTNWHFCDQVFSNQSGNFFSDRSISAETAEEHTRASTRERIHESALFVNLRHRIDTFFFWLKHKSTAKPISHFLLQERAHHQAIPSTALLFQNCMWSLLFFLHSTLPPQPFFPEHPVIQSSTLQIFLLYSLFISILLWRLSDFLANVMPRATFAAYTTIVVYESQSLTAAPHRTARHSMSAHFFSAMATRTLRWKKKSYGQKTRSAIRTLDYKMPIWQSCSLGIDHEVLSKQ